MNFDSFVLAAATTDLYDEPAAREHADAVEFRMDLADDPLDALATYDGELPIVATNRAAWEGGEAGSSSTGPGDEAVEADRLSVLETAAEFSFVEAIDVELRSAREDRGATAIEHARDHDAAVIVSTHDFEGTPERSALCGLLAEAASAGDVGKLAVTATDRGDALSLLAATHERTTAGDRVATMAMGEVGRHSRAVAPVYGSKVGYAPVDPADATAPGQYDLATLAELVERLRSETGQNPKIKGGREGSRG